MLSRLVRIGARDSRAQAGATHLRAGAATAPPVRTRSIFGRGYARALKLGGGGGHDPSAESHIVDEPAHQRT